MIYISMAILPIYLLITYILIGKLPASISDTYYLYLHKYGIKWPFKAVLCSIVATLMPVWFELSDKVNNNITFLAFLSCVCLIGVAIKADFLYGDKKYHYSFTAIAFILSLLWTILVGFWTIPVIMYANAIIATVLFYEHYGIGFNQNLAKAKALLWFELAAFCTIQITLRILTEI